MKSSSEKVSVIIPVYNASRWAESIVDSINSNFARIGEVLLVNDGDEKDFIEFFKKVQASINIPIRNFSSQGKEGPGKARNIGMDYASFEYIAFHDCDDVWSAGSLEKRLELLDRNDRAPFVYSSYYRINMNGQVTNLTIVPPVAKLENLFVTNFIFLSSVIARRTSVGEMRFKEIGHEDYDFWLRLIIASGANAVGLKNPVCNLRAVHGSVSSVKSQAAKWHYRILRSNDIPLVLRLLLFTSYSINGLLKRKIYKYRPFFFCLDRLVGLWLSQRH